MISACRQALGGTQITDGHAGLVRDRCLRAHKEMEGAGDRSQPTPEEELLRVTAQCKASEAYRLAFGRWKEIARARGWLTIGAVTAGALAVGLGNASPLEIGLTIHHTYGMPVIPGSGVKGVLRRATEKAGLKRDSPEFIALFGDTKSASGFTFWDAWYDPNSVEGRPFHRDVITVHHPKYYGSGGKGDTWPTDFDNPNPVPFLVVRPGARFLFAVECPSSEWASFVRGMLEWAVENLGLGGKTNAGYGRFTPDAPDLAAIQTTPASALPDQLTWSGAALTYDRGRGVLIAVSEAGRAESARAATPGLFDKMAPELAVSIRDKKKPGSANVVVRHLGGRRYALVDIVAEEGRV